MRYIDTIFIGICVLIIIVSAYIKRDKLVTAFKTSPIVSSIVLVLGILILLVLLGIVVTLVIRI